MNTIYRLGVYSQLDWDRTQEADLIRQSLDDGFVHTAYTAGVHSLMLHQSLAKHSNGQHQLTGACTQLRS